MMKKSDSPFGVASIFIFLFLWLGSSGCSARQPRATERPQVEEQTAEESTPSPTNPPLPSTITPISPTNTPKPESEPTSLQVPLGGAASIDGIFSAGEWDNALLADLANGGELMLMHNDGYLYLGIRSRAMGVGSICTVDDSRVSILHSSGGLGTAVFEKDGADWRRTRQFSYCCWEATQNTLDEFLQTEGWVASVGTKGVPEEMEYKIAMNNGSLTLAVVYLDDFTFTTALHWPENLDDDCLELALIPEEPPERLSFSPQTWVRATAALEAPTS
jgi:hypothetical protein